jgi:EmrB/QacA subfamily drug resistance transporter
MTGTSAATTRLDRATVVALVAVALGIFVIANDFTALAVVVVDIENDLGTTLNRAQWVINAYTVVFGVLIVTGGRLADLLGRRRVFLVGATIFATFSLLGGLAPNIELLIAARALMGIGGAMMWPAVLGMTFGLLPEEKAGLAGGLVLGVAGLGNAAGPLIAGLLTDFLDWRWVFFINLPIALTAIVITRRNVRESRAGERVGIDYLGIVTLSAAVILILVALDVGTAEGFGDPLVLVMFVAGLVLLAVFAFVERHAGAAALLPRRVTASVQFTSAVLSVMAMSVVFFAVLVFVPQLAEKDQGWSALEAGAGLLPLMLLFAGMSFLAGRLYNRLGARVVVSSGAVCLTLGVLWLAFTIGSSYALLVPGLVVMGTGVGLYYSAITTAAVTAVPASDNSLAGGIVYMAQIAGGSIGIGLNTAIVLSANTLADGIRIAFFVDAALGLVGTVIAIALIRGDGSAHVPHHRLYHRAHG